MALRRRFAKLAFVAVAIIIAAVPSAQALVEAKQAFEDSDYVSAYARFHAIAEDRTLPPHRRAVAEGYIAQMHLEGLGTAQSDDQAAAWALRAARSDDVSAQLNLARFYEEGIGVAQDHAEARRWYERASRTGDNRAAPLRRVAQMRLATIYDQGIGLERDPAMAAQWYLLAADDQRNSGNIDAMYRLGEMHSHGDGVERSAEKAWEFVRRAAARGHYQAHFLVLEHKAKGGDVEAMLQLGALWGRSGSADKLVFAHVWFFLASQFAISSGLSLEYKTVAENTVQELELVMSPTQIDQARELANGFMIDMQNAGRD